MELLLCSEAMEVKDRAAEMKQLSEVSSQI